MAENVGGEPQAAESEVQMVPVTEASDAELQAFLDQHGQSEEGETEQASEQSEEAGQDNESDSEETSNEESQTDGSQEKVTLTKAEFDALKGDADKNKQLVKHKEQFIQRKLSENKDLRAQLRAAREALEKGLEDKFAESPAKGLQDSRKIQELESHEQALEQEEQLIAHVQNTYEQVKQHVKLEEIQVDDVRQTLKERGMDDQTIDAFIKNPYAHAHAGELIEFFHRVRAEGVLRKMVPYVRQLLEERKSLKEKPEKLVKQISQTAAQAVQVNGSTGNGGLKRGIADVDPTKLSDQDLNELAKQMGLKVRI